MLKLQYLAQKQIMHSEKIARFLAFCIIMTFLTSRTIMRGLHHYHGMSIGGNRLAVPHRCIKHRRTPYLS